jgi:MFS superfamily sulfate permease-like transporter
MVASSIALLAAVLFLSLFHFLPKSIVSGVILGASLMLIEFDYVIKVWKLRGWAEISVATLVFLSTFILGPSAGIIITVLLSTSLLIRRVTSLELFLLSSEDEGADDKGAAHLQVSSSPSNREGIVLIRVEESLHFGNASQLREIIRRIELFGAPHVHPSAEKSSIPVRGLILDLEPVLLIDAEAVTILEEIVNDFLNRGIPILFIHIHKQPRKMMRRGGIIGQDSSQTSRPSDQNRDSNMEIVRERLRSFSSAEEAYFAL